MRCLRDIWTPLGESVEFEVKVAGYPQPELTWYHNDKKLVEKSTVQVRLQIYFWKNRHLQIQYVSDDDCHLKISNVSSTELGNYVVEASNVHGVVRTSGALNVGKPRHLSPPKFVQREEPIAVKSKVAFAEQVSQDFIFC